MKELSVEEVPVKKPALPLNGKGLNWLTYGVIRLIQIVISFIILLFSSPILIVMALAIRLDSPGRALFRQIRVGKNMEPFTFYKFRTLYINAKELYPELYAYRYTLDQIEQLRFKREEDPRITRIGKWLRKSTLDELPNFWNVLKGDMNFVGPRPEIYEMAAYYTEEQLTKFLVKPGITGLAQISGRGRLSFQDTLSYDVQYVKSCSLLQDFKIILKTVKQILLRDGAF